MARNSQPFYGLAFTKIEEAGYNLPIGGSNLPIRELRCLGVSEHEMHLESSCSPSSFQPAQRLCRVASGWQEPFRLLGDKASNSDCRSSFSCRRCQRYLWRQTDTRAVSGKNIHIKKGRLRQSVASPVMAHSTSGMGRQLWRTRLPGAPISCVHMHSAIIHNLPRRISGSTS